MNLYLILVEENNSYDEYDSAVVVAKNEEEAKRIFPNDQDSFVKKYKYNEEKKKFLDPKNIADDGWYSGEVWTNDLEKIKVEYLGIADKKQKRGEVICASFNAG